MGDNVIDDAQVIFEHDIDGEEYVAGGQTGRVIVESVTLTLERPTNGYSGLGNEGEVAVGYGTRTVSMDFEEMLNQRAAEMLEAMYENQRSPTEVSILAGDVLDVSGAKFDWNELELGLENDGDQVVSVTGKVRGIDIEANP